MVYLSVLGSLVLILSTGLTQWVLNKSVDWKMIDFPNNRSAHRKSTPTGGGIAFVFSFLIILGLSQALLPSKSPLAFLLLIGGPIVAFLGWVDDRYHLSSRLRLVVQSFVVSGVCYILTDGFSTDLGFSLLPQVSLVQLIFSFLFLAWFINLYNFMDGSDGLVGSVTVVNSLLLAGLSWNGQVSALTLVYALLAFATLGFLVFNWSPAKLFMGDSGAYFLGFTLAVAALFGQSSGQISLYSHCILFAPFIMDTTYTLILRTLHKENIFAAHRQQLAHKLVDNGWSHDKLAVTCNLYILVWLAPLATWAETSASQQWVPLVIAYFPLLVLQKYFKAGHPIHKLSAVVPFPQKKKIQNNQGKKAS